MAACLSSDEVGDGLDEGIVFLGQLGGNTEEVVAESEEIAAVAYQHAVIV